MIWVIIYFIGCFVFQTVQTTHDFLEGYRFNTFSDNLKYGFVVGAMTLVWPILLPRPLGIVIGHAIRR